MDSCYIYIIFIKRNRFAPARREKRTAIQNIFHAVMAIEFRIFYLSNEHPTSGSCIQVTARKEYIITRQESRDNLKSN